MGVKVTNNAFGTLSAAINTSATTITLDSGQGSRFPTLGSGDYFFGTLVDTSNNLEIVKVTARSSDSLTVVRGQDGTSGTAFAIGDRFELRPVAALFEDIIDNASVDGITSASSSGVAMSITSGNDVGFNTSAPCPTQVAIQTGGGGQGVLLARNASGTSPTQGQEFGAFGWKGIMDGANTLNAAEAKIVALATENHSGTAAGTRMEFHVKDNGVGPGSAASEAMRITQEGFVNKFKQPSWHVAISSRTNWTATGLQKTPYDNAIHRTPTSAYDPTTNFRFTAPVAGKYQATISQNGIGDIIIYLYKNGTVYHAGEFRDNGSSAWMHNTISTVVTMAANDYLEAYVKLTGSGNAWNGGSSTWDSFSGFLIG
jgi:hypothetical protein|tara:strand:+ start:971 stop:2083 length:1113 start_codon:yes stop_codon:yes gene_type:complete